MGLEGVPVSGFQMFKDVCRAALPVGEPPTLPEGGWQLIVFRFGELQGVHDSVVGGDDHESVSECG